MAGYEPQFKAFDEAPKTLVVREMIPEDIKRERKFDEIMENLEIVISEMMADDGPVPMDLFFFFFSL